MTGKLVCGQCHASFKILRGVPRFVELSNCVDGFGFQWNKHALTQHDSHSKSAVSEDRFSKETRWSRNRSNESILEVGCGSGRCSALAISTGAVVVATDLNGEVDANYRVHKDVENLLIVQSNIYRMPFRKESFDKAFCLGVLQHTPDVEKSFRIIPGYLKQGGSYVTDIYDKRNGLLGFFKVFYRTYFWVRPITRRMPTQLLYQLVPTVSRNACCVRAGNLGLSVLILRVELLCGTVFGAGCPPVVLPRYHANRSSTVADSNFISRSRHPRRMLCLCFGVVRVFTGQRFGSIRRSKNVGVDRFDRARWPVTWAHDRTNAKRRGGQLVVGEA